MKKEKSNVEKYEASLLEEEKVLESITEGLKGVAFVDLFSSLISDICDY